MNVGCCCSYVTHRTIKVDGIRDLRSLEMGILTKKDVVKVSGQCTELAFMVGTRSQHKSIQIKGWPRTHLESSSIKGSLEVSISKEGGCC